MLIPTNRRSAPAPLADSAEAPRRQRASVGGGFVIGMVAAQRARGNEPMVETLLEQAGVPAAILDDRSLRIGVDRYADLYNRLAAALDDEAFGMFATPLRSGSFEFLCRAALGAPDLTEALDRVARFLRLVLPELQFESWRGDSARAIWSIAAVPGTSMAARRTDDPVRVFAFEWLLRLVHALACWLAGRGLALDRVRFPYARPDHAGDYALIYTDDSRFDPNAPRLEATLSALLLDLPVRRDETSLGEFLRGSPGRIAQLYRRDRETVQRVRDLLRFALPELPSAGAVARRFNLSERSLHRRLADEGSNFRTVRDALRRDLALSRLARSDLPLATIAAELGFGEPSAFYRAVVGWTGKSPSAYRRSLRQMDGSNADTGREDTSMPGEADTPPPGQGNAAGS